jgi:hypothetical protein
MKELCIPIPHFQEKESAEIILKVGDEMINYNFRVVSFPWEVEDEYSNGDDHLSKSLARISRLKNAINSYDKEWELIQIYTPLDEAKFIQVLYRHKKRI